MSFHNLMVAPPGPYRKREHPRRRDFFGRSDRKCRVPCTVPSQRAGDLPNSWAKAEPASRHREN
jgi:hypothetical protein